MYILVCVHFSQLKLSEEVCSVLNDTVVAELDEEATLKTFSCYISVKNIRALGAQPTVDWK